MDCGGKHSHICADCFEHSQCRHHNSVLVHRAGGFCDCGDVAYWKKEGFCSKHKGFSPELSEQGIQALPPGVSDRLTQVVEFLCRIIVEECEMKNEGWADNNNEKLAWLLEMANICPAFLLIVTKALLKPYVTESALVCEYNFAPPAVTEIVKDEEKINALAECPETEVIHPCKCHTVDFLMKIAHYLDKSQGATIKQLFTAIIIDLEVSRELSRSILRHFELVVKTLRWSGYNMIYFTHHLVQHNDYSCFEYTNEEKLEEILRLYKYFMLKMFYATSHGDMSNELWGQALRTPKVLGALAGRPEDAADMIEKTTILESLTRTFILVHEFPSTAENPDLGFRMEKLMIKSLETLYPGLKSTTSLDAVWDALRYEQFDPLQQLTFSLLLRWLANILYRIPNVEIPVDLHQMFLMETAATIGHIDSLRAGYHGRLQNVNIFYGDSENYFDLDLSLLQLVASQAKSTCGVDIEKGYSEADVWVRALDDED